MQRQTSEETPQTNAQTRLTIKPSDIATADLPYATQKLYNN